MNIQLSIYRFNSVTADKPHYDKYTIPYSKGMTVLDAVMYVQTHLDPTLAYRFECRQGICGTCGLMLNGKPVLSCSTQIEEGDKEQVIEPLANFPIEKDLIVNIEPILDRYAKVKPYIDKIRKVTLSKDVANQSKPFRKCIECGCCIAGSKTIAGESKHAMDPMDLVKIARYLTDPRDGTNRQSIIQESGVEHYNDEEGKILASLCPRGVPIDEAIALIKQHKTR